MANPFISIIVVGKNEEKNLDRLCLSLKCIADQWDCETIFVDSASKDSSVEVAKKLFDKVIVLLDSPHLNASAGRNIGVTVATGRWALFLDGDMEVIPGCVAKLKEFFVNQSDDCGYVGNYIHQYSNGTTIKWKPTVDKFGMVTQFGGAVLLPIAALQKENWDPRLYSNEEIDLYTRLRSHGYKIYNLNVDFINHWTSHVSIHTKLLGNFYPNHSYLGKKFYGIGQLLCARLKSGRLTNLIFWWPDPFLLWGVLLLSPLIGLWKGWYLSFLFVMCVFLFIAKRRRSWKVIIYYMAFLPQALYGFRYFKLDWMPIISATYINKTEADTSEIFS